MIEKLQKSGLKVTIDPKLVAKHMIAKLHAEAPHIEVKSSIGFGASIGSKSIELERPVSVRPLERELGAIAGEISLFAVKTGATEITVTADPKTGRLEVAKTPSRALTVRCESLFTRE